MHSFIISRSLTRYCPSPFDTSFYSLTISFSLPQAGTFWYHSHFSNQYCDGLRGPLVIYDPEDPYADLYDVDDGKLSHKYVLVRNSRLVLQQVL